MSPYVDPPPGANGPSLVSPLAVIPFLRRPSLPVTGSADACKWGERGALYSTLAHPALGVFLVASDYQGVRRLTMAVLYDGMLGVSIPAAIVLLVLFGISKKSAYLGAAVVWLLPLLYEYVIQSTCSGECNIRIDLVVVLPGELVVLAVSTRVAIAARREPRRTRRA